jgi:hypothetical protein
MVGHEPVGGDPHVFIRQAQQDGRALYVKTHEPPPADRHPAIYAVRDSRSSVVCYAHFLCEILGHDITLAQVIGG